MNPYEVSLLILCAAQKYVRVQCTLLPVGVCKLSLKSGHRILAVVALMYQDESTGGELDMQFVHC